MLRYKLFRYLIVIIIFAAVLGAFYFRAEIDLNKLLIWQERYPTITTILFIAIYAILVPLFFPSTLLALLGGVLFGPLRGTLYNEISAVLGAILCFVIARAISEDWVERNIPADIKHLKQGVDKEGWRFVLMMRLVPWMPYALMNYALGVTAIRFLLLTSITALCIFPRVAAYAYIGHAGRMAMAGKETIGQLLLIVPLAFAVILLPYLMIKVYRDLTG
jgi:uncharacterized membrane protein YdjX (TVP38/TMEM64 family)